MLAATVVAVALLQPTAPNVEDPVEFALTYAQALGRAYEGLMAINNTVSRADATDVALISARKRGAMLCREAARMVAPFAKSKDSLIRLAGEGATNAFTIVADGTHRHAAILIDLATMSNPTEQRLKALIDESTTLDAKMENAWRALPAVTVATTYAFLSDGGKGKRLRITRKDRDRIVTGLELSLGRDVKDPKKMQAVVVAGRLLREFLVETEFPYADQ